MTVEANGRKQNEKAGVFRYLFVLLVILYFLLLFGERTAAVVMGFTADEPFWTKDDPARWYAHIVTLASLIAAFIAAIVNGRAFAFLFTRSAECGKRISMRRMALMSGLVLVGGMAHTDFTLLALQFVAYGLFFIGLAFRAAEAGTKSRPDIGVMRLVLSFAYLLCFSMAIPVVYSTSLVNVQTAFVTLEIVTALLLVAAFTHLVEVYCRSGGLLNFGIPVIVYTIAADIALIVLRAPESVNVFVAVFLVITVVLWLIGRIAYGEKVLPYFGGRYAKKSYFEGWYVKMTDTEGRAVAVILSYHVGAKGNKYAMMQFACDGGFAARISADEFEAEEDKLCARIGDSHLDTHGMNINVVSGENSASGSVRFGALFPPRRDIMGPFASFPFMECKHGVVSMKHTVSGSLTVNGKTYTFNNGAGYIEKDLGRSFPSDYLWTQGTDGSSSVMAAIAKIPYMGIAFTGCICFVYTGGKEYRLATYNFARAKRRADGSTFIKRGKYGLEITPVTSDPQRLAAPTNGDMKREVCESVSSETRYVFTCDGKVVLDMTSPAASHEVAVADED